MSGRCKKKKKGRSLCVTFVTPILCVHDYTDEEEEEGYYKKRVRIVAPQQEPPLSLEAFPIMPTAQGIFVC